MDKEKNTKQSLKFVNEGFLFGIANDLNLKGKYLFLQNVRKDKEGVIESRPILDTAYGFNPDPNDIPHTIKAILYQAANTNLRIVGVGTKLYTGNIPTLFLKDSGYSGKPFSVVDFRPEQSIETYLYIADENKLKKISANDILADIGITAPSKAATWKIGSPNRKIIDKIDTGSAAQWNNITGSAGVPTDELRVNTTIAAIAGSYLADGALPNYASIVPTAFTSELQADSIVTLNGSEDVIVEEVIPAALNTGIATITKIVYDVGATGMATIVLSVSSADLRRDSIVLLNGTEYVRVQDVTRDSNGIPSIRVSTVGTFANGNTISGAASFRFYATVGYAAGNTIISRSVKSIIGATGISSITRIFNVDLQNTGVTGKPLTNNDIFHISLLLSLLSSLVEMKIQLDVDSTTNDFTKNYYEYTISPNFFIGASSTLSAVQQSLYRNNLLIQAKEKTFLPTTFEEDNGIIPVDPLTSQTTLGASQWTEADIRLGDFLKVGSDNSRTLKDVKAIRISVNTNAAVDLFIDALWVGGADVLESNVQGFLPYNYVWRIRDPATRVYSNWSPPLRTGIKISRGRIVLAFPNANIDYSVNYKIDIARFGGTLSDFRILGSLKNDASEYTDSSSDRIIADNDLAGRFSEQGAIDAVFDFYKPFAILDTPKKGTCDIVGAQFTWVSGDKLNITYPRGTQIVINGIANSFYTNPISTGATNAATKVELERDMGNLVGVVFEVQEPLLTGQPLPIIFGTFGEGNFGLFIFGLGDKNAAGTLYWLDGNTPDTQSDTNKLEITPPSEPLVSGVIYDGFGFVWTTKRSFLITPTVAADGSFSFIARENANSRGLYSRWAIDVGPDSIYFLSENADGIYKVAGNGNPQLITEGFNNLFYINGKSPSPITLTDGTIIYPPNFTLYADLRIFCMGDYMIFRFVDTDIAGAKQVAMVFDIKSQNWISYDTFPDNQVNAFYKEELENDANVFAGVYNGVKKFGKTGNYEAAITSKVIPFSFDAGDARILKHFYELMFSIDPGLSGLSYRNLFDNGDVLGITTNIAGSNPHKRTQFIINLKDVFTQQGFIAQNLATKFEWLITSGVKLYEEVIYYDIYGDEITDRSSDLTSAGTIGEKLFQGVIIQTDTFGVNKVLQFLDDQNIIQATITINHSGLKTVAYSFPQPFISHTITRTSIDGVAWIEPQEVYVFDPEPEEALVWEGEFDNNNLAGLLLMKRLGMAYRSTAVSSIKFFFDDDSVQTYSLPASAGKFSKNFQYVIAKKFKACKYRIESTAPIRIYKKHCEVWIKEFNSISTVSSRASFNAVQPFGGDSNISDVRI